MMYRLIPESAVVFDIGANIGWYCNHIAATRINSTVFGFEPIPETFGLLSSNSALNELPNLQVRQMAFSEKPEELTFYFSPRQTGASSSKNITDNSEMVELKIKSTTVDDFMETNQTAGPDFIKCDVEGAELMVFRGAMRTIEKYQPVVFSEMLRKWSARFGYHPNDIISLFASLGYQCFFTEDSKLLRITEVTDDTAATNFFFLHPVKHEVYIKNLTH
jgi:FkbM family methyltransferase